MQAGTAASGWEFGRGRPLWRRREASTVATEVLDGERPTGDEHRTRDAYFGTHDVTRPQHATEDDLPPADLDDEHPPADPVRELDLDALAEEKLGGKFHVVGSADRIEELWPGIVDDVDDQTLWGAKAMTATGFDAHPGDQYVLLVYTPNYFATHDVERVRDRLRETYGVAEELFYKPNVYSAKGIQPDTAGEWGLEMAYRFGG